MRSTSKQELISTQRTEILRLTEALGDGEASLEETRREIQGLRSELDEARSRISHLEDEIVVRTQELERLQSLLSGSRKGKMDLEKATETEVILLFRIVLFLPVVGAAFDRE